ncbi:MAG: nicotinate phosphoribosyltransferase [Candidatus Rifleibacteriota bacterium]
MLIENYGPSGSLSLLTDLYQLTMAYGYWKTNHTDKQGIFNLFFRKNPFNSGYTIACGLEQALELLSHFRFDSSDIDYLSTLKGNDNSDLFDKGFLDYLANMEFCCDVEAVEEGTVVFPHEPMLRITGPIIQCQILETPLLNILNFQSLIATKAARICQAAGGQPVLEFGLRRAQGINGALSASRAAYIGGCNSTSNVLAGKLFGIPVKGTHAHSWVMSFADEEEAFSEYARAMPNNCLFLVDTYNTLEGVKKAINVGKKLRESGHELVGIRLDSGDLAYLSIEARKLLDDAGFEKAVICASNDLDEHIITSLKQQGATIALWGVGTKLATGYDQPALGGVYKLVALKEPGKEWEHKIKLSEQAIKVTNPGKLQIRRYINNGEAVGDMLYDELLPKPDKNLIIDPADGTRRKQFPDSSQTRDLLVPVIVKGKVVYKSKGIHAARDRVKADLALFHEGIKRFVNPHLYPVGLEERLYKLKTDLILKNRGFI